MSGQARIEKILGAMRTMALVRLDRDFVPCGIGIDPISSVARRTRGGILNGLLGRKIVSRTFITIARNRMAAAMDGLPRAVSAEHPAGRGRTITIIA